MDRARSSKHSDSGDRFRNQGGTERHVDVIRRQIEELQNAWKEQKERFNGIMKKYGVSSQNFGADLGQKHFDEGSSETFPHDIEGGQYDNNWEVRECIKDIMQDVIEEKKIPEIDLNAENYPSPKYVEALKKMNDRIENGMKAVFIYKAVQKLKEPIFEIISDSYKEEFNSIVETVDDKCKGLLVHYEEINKWRACEQDLEECYEQIKDLVKADLGEQWTKQYSAFKDLLQEARNRFPQNSGDDLLVNSGQVHTGESSSTILPQLIDKIPENNPKIKGYSNEIDDVIYFSMFSNAYRNEDFVKAYEWVDRFKKHIEEVRGEQEQQERALNEAKSTCKSVQKLRKQVFRFLSDSNKEKFNCKFKEWLVNREKINNWQSCEQDMKKLYEQLKNIAKADLNEKWKKIHKDLLQKAENNPKIKDSSNKIGVELYLGTLRNVLRNEDFVEAYDCADQFRKYIEQFLNQQEQQGCTEPGVPEIRGDS